MSWVAVGTTAVGVVGSALSSSANKSGSEASSTQSNPALQQYTQHYSSAAPWAFAGLDPNATLAKWRSADMAENKSWLWKDGKYVGPAAFRKQIQAQADAEQNDQAMTKAALDRIQTRQTSGQFLTPQETEFINTSLDKAFEYAHKTGMEDWTKATQMMAGSRGMRMSDSPVADPAMRELRNFEIGLGSKRAEMQLGATLDFSKNQQDFDRQFAEFNRTLDFNRTSMRMSNLFGGGMSGVQGGSSTTTGQQTSAPSLMSNIGTGLDTGSRIGSMFMSARAGSSGRATSVPSNGGYDYGTPSALSKWQ